MCGWAAVDKCLHLEKINNAQTVQKESGRRRCSLETSYIPNTLSIHSTDVQHYTLPRPCTAGFNSLQQHKASAC